MQKFHSQWPCGVSKFGRQRQHDNDTNFMPSGFCCTWTKSLKAGTDVIRWWSPCSWLLRRRWSQSWCFFDDHWSGPCTKPRYSCCGRKETTEGCRQVSAGAGGNIRCNARSGDNIRCKQVLALQRSKDSTRPHPKSSLNILCPGVGVLQKPAHCLWVPVKVSAVQKPFSSKQQINQQIFRGTVAVGWSSLLLSSSSSLLLLLQQKKIFQGTLAVGWLSDPGKARAALQLILAVALHRLTGMT